MRPQKEAFFLKAMEQRDLINHLQKALWFDFKAEPPCWNPDKEWSPETLDDVASWMRFYGLGDFE